ncbi:hypothetical protein [Hornefia butyriciproducens]|uniref:hypothetical protein n=1 Tax=Hornefia butyriciproducens TaxID=2652293 RepID=UPI003F88EE66
MASKKELNRDIDAILDRAVTNFSMSIPAEIVENNAKFEMRAGMRPRIVRSSGGNSCAWCSSLAGEYYADEAPDDIYRRHDNCTCTVTYISEKGYQDAHTKKWIEREEVDARCRRIDADNKYTNSQIIKRQREAASRKGEAEDFRRKEKAIRGIRATGRNKFSKGFTKKNLKEHFGPEGRHTKEYPGWTAKKYEREALKLVQSRTTDDIIGYKTKNGAVVRYRKSTNDLVVGYPNGGIATMFKPKGNTQKGYQYVLGKMKKEGIIHD